IDLMSFKAKASSMLYAKDRLWKQDVIDTITYPNAYEDVGKVEPIVYGKDILMPALRTDWGAKTTLKADIIASSVSLELSDASRFPSSGSVWIDDEKIGYVSKSGNILNTLTRAQSGTTATSHRAGAETWEHKAQYDSLLASHELHSLGDIFAEIDRKLLRVTSGVSGVYENGKHKLRATEQIKVQAVKDDVGISQGSHGHSSPATQTRIPISASHGGNWFNWSGVDANVFDQSDITYLQGNNNTIDLGWGMITANFNAYTGPTPTAVYLCVTHTFSSSVVGAIPKIAGEGGLWIDLDASGVKVTQKVYFGTTVPTQVKYKGENNSTARNISFYVYEMWLEVHTSSTSSDPATGVAKTGGIIATRTVDRFHAVVSGYKDPDGKYGGIGSLIERPDLVIKHFLVQKMGFSFSEIDTMSFNKASVDYGILCSGAGFAFVIDSKIKPSEQLKRLAFECRSTVKYIKGMWYLDVLADTAPSALRTITYKELAGEGARFVFSKIPIYALANDLSAKFKKAYSKLGSESDWDGTSKITDSTSATKYGSYPKEFEFEFVRTQSMADNVLTHILKQRKMPYLVVSFPVFWEHFDLKVGDTIEIDNPLYDGKKFFIEEIRRDKAKAEVKAVEWWYGKKFFIEEIRRDKAKAEVKAVEWW
ncbi:MAG: hypothetical protein HY805_04620, partial [Nitrospirae bacterium]|nr:hypothetical protein [Nitrospirota bacterium]